MTVQLQATQDQVERLIDLMERIAISLESISSRFIQVSEAPGSDGKSCIMIHDVYRSE
jgi:hypothetical protein